MSLKSEVRRTGDVSIIDLAGRITLGEGSGLVRRLIKDVLLAGQKKILINLENVTYIDSAGLGELVGAYASVTNQAGSIKLLHAQSKVHDLLQVTKLYTVFDVYDDEAEALRSFVAAAGAGSVTY